MFCKVRQVLYALQNKEEVELDGMEKERVIRKVERSVCVSLIVCVPKKDKGIRVCGDFKVIINQSLVNNSYSLSEGIEMFACLSDRIVFSKVGQSNAYQWVEIN